MWQGLDFISALLGEGLYLSSIKQKCTAGKIVLQAILSSLFFFETDVDSFPLTVCMCLSFFCIFDYVIQATQISLK